MEETRVVEWSEVAERLLAAAERLEQAVEAQVGRIVATVDGGREAELERRLAEAEAKLAELKAAATEPQGGRRTLGAGTEQLLSKHGLSRLENGEGLEAGALDGALASLSVEQRIAVKAELLRAGLLG